jgi:hypothetical protein
MALTVCPKCSGDLLAQAETCPHCGFALGDAGAQRSGVAANKIPQEILDWARSQFNEEEFVAGLREIRETGGLALEDFIGELEKAAAPPE